MLRLQARESQAVIADFLGVSQNQVGRIENAKASPTADMLIAFAKRWGVSVGYICGMSDSPTGLVADSYLVDVDAKERARSGEPWWVRIPARHKIVDRDELDQMKKENRDAHRKNTGA